MAKGEDIKMGWTRLCDGAMNLSTNGAIGGNKMVLGLEMEMDVFSLLVWSENLDAYLWWLLNYMPSFFLNI